jgi:periplasmic glucans biosynthesis protein
MMTCEESMRGRRDFLRLAAAGALSGGTATLAGAFGVARAAPAAAAAAPAGAKAAPQTAPAPTPFVAGSVLDMARQLAKSPFKAPNTSLPEPFANLTYEQYVGIRAKPNSALWSGDNAGFAVEPLHRGFIFSTPMEINVVDNGMAQRVRYDPAAFDFGKLRPPANLPDIGFSGFRVLQAIEGQGFQEVAIYQGASFFRAKARGQNLGVMARGLSIHTGEPQGEEFPLFRAVWIEKPKPAANALVIHALLDSASVTGAFRFTLRPGEATIIDTELTIVARAAIDHFGLSAMSAMYLFGGLDPSKIPDIRPNVYEVSGLQMLTGAGEWIWRPVANRDTLQISAFVDQNPRGFGLLQRDRSFSTFQDDDQHWELRPSLWIEPIGDWGDGQVQLVEIPTTSENNGNIIAFWRPKAGLAEKETQSFAYRQFWCWTPPARPPLAVCSEARMGKIGKYFRFAVEFSGEMFANATAAAQIKLNMAANPGRIVSRRIFTSSERKTLRVLFDLEPGSEPYSELRLVLEAGGRPASETWLYRWTA